MSKIETLSLPPESPDCATKIVSQLSPGASTTEENGSGVMSTGSNKDGSTGIGLDNAADGSSRRPSDSDMDRINFLDTHGSNLEKGIGSSSFDDLLHSSNVDINQTNGLQTDDSTCAMIEEGWFKSPLEEGNGSSSASSEASNGSVSNQEYSTKSTSGAESVYSKPRIACSGEHACNLDIVNAAGILSREESIDSAAGENCHSKIDPSINHDVDGDVSLDRSSSIDVSNNKETRPNESFAPTILNKEDGSSPSPSEGTTDLKEPKRNSAEIAYEAGRKCPFNATNVATLNEVVDLCSSDSDDEDRKAASAPFTAEASAKISSDDGGSISLSCSNSSNNGAEFLNVGQKVSVSKGKREHDATIVSLKDGWAEVQWSWGKATELVPVSSIKLFACNYSKRIRKKPELFAFSSSLRTEESSKLPATKKARQTISTGDKHVSGQNRPIISSTTKIKSMNALNGETTPSSRKQSAGLKRKESSAQLAGSIDDKDKAISLEKVPSDAPSSRKQREKQASEAYYKIVGILDRRETPYDKGSKCFVEYLVQWEDSPTGEAYEPTWQPAEDLDHNSLVIAFHKYPVKVNSGRDQTLSMKGENALEQNNHKPSDLADMDLSEDEEPTEEEEEEDEDCDDYNSELEDAGEEEELMDFTTQSEICQLRESDYDKKGTAELIINRKCYRVGQSYYSACGESILTISVIDPNSNKATCTRYIRMEDTFVCPNGKEGTYIALKGDELVDLLALKNPCNDFPKCELKYEQNGRMICYYNEDAKMVNDPLNKPTVLDLWAGAGGMSIGFEKAGFSVVGAVDNNKDAVATLRANKKGNIAIFQEKVSSFLRNSRQGKAGYAQPGEVKHVHGSPPCKGFSRANRNGGKDDMINNKQTYYFFKSVQHFLPLTASMENVQGIFLDSSKRYLQDVVANLLAIGYQVRVDILNASSYGDPQNRKRVILFAARNEILLPSTPLPTRGPNLLPVKTCENAIGMLEKFVPSTSGSGVISVCNSSLIYNHVISSGKRGHDDWTLKANEPARTVLASCRPHIHYNGKRRLSVREAACLQSFPLTYVFCGSVDRQFSQVGNAVPVCLATAIARSFAVSYGIDC